MASENYNASNARAPTGYENPATTEASLDTATNPNAARYQPQTAQPEAGAATTATAGQSRFDSTTPSQGTVGQHSTTPSSANAPATSTGATATGDTASGRRQSRGFMDTVKGVMAQGHGMGETARGNFNAKVDELLGDEEGRQKDKAIAEGGKVEFTNKEFLKKGWDKTL